MNKYIVIFLLLINPLKILVGQNIDCKLYIDDIKKGDTLKISIEFFVERNKFFEQISIFMDETSNYRAIYSNDKVRNKLITLDSEKIETIRLFELSIRNQSLKSNMPIFLCSQAEYTLCFKNGTISYYSKLKFYSFVKLFNIINYWED